MAAENNQTMLDAVQRFRLRQTQPTVNQFDLIQQQLLEGNQYGGQQSVLLSPVSPAYHQLADEFSEPGTPRISETFEEDIGQREIVHQKQPRQQPQPFDIETFIEEIRLQPCLWNFKLNAYKDQTKRKIAWNKIKVSIGGDVNGK